MNRIVKQHDSRDCGAACLSMIAAHYGAIYPLSTARELTKTDSIGTNMYGLVDGGRQIGLEAEALQGSSEELLEGINIGEINLPFVAHTVTEDGLAHFVVVFGWNGNRFMIGDPAKGKVMLSSEDFFRVWTGYIVTYHKTDAFVRGRFTPSNRQKIKDLLQGQYLKLISMFLCSILVALIGILGAYVFKSAMESVGTMSTAAISTAAENTGISGIAASAEAASDAAVTASFHDPADRNILNRVVGLFTGDAALSLNTIFLFVLMMYLLQGLLMYLRGVLTASVARTLDTRMILRYFDHLVDLPLSSVTSRQTGEHLSRLSDAEVIRDTIASAGVSICFDTILAAGSCVLLFLFNTKMALIAVLIIFSYILLAAVFHFPVSKASRSVMERNAVVQAYIKESIDGIETIKTNNAQEKVRATVRNKYAAYTDRAYRSNLIEELQKCLAGTAQLVGEVLVIWLGFTFVQGGQLSLGDLLTFYTLLSFFVEPLKNLIQMQPMIQKALVARDRLNDVLDLQTETQDQGKKAAPGEINSWELSHVDFRYGNNELTLKDVSLQIHRGDKIAIVGESGSGKTTISKLFSAIHQPENGHVLINGNDIHSYDLSSLRNEIAYVDQNTFLFSGTILDNLTLGNPECSLQEVEKACRLSCIDTMIEELPFQYKSELEENGMNLSGGQRQRLAIARALIKHPQLLILDEATSNLDTITEQEILRNISAEYQDTTVLMIAHRLSTIRECSRIIVMKKGEVVESGSHEELMAQGGQYSALWKAQMQA